MDFKRLPSNSEKLLLEIISSDNPIEMLSSRFEGISNKDDDILRGIIRELCQEGYVSIKWADNVPYFVAINNSARTYEEQMNKDRMESSVDKQSQVIFISHRSTDKNVADAVFDFFVGTGIPREMIFCSSLPGNDVKHKISDEVKNAIKNSCLNIAILSNDYYKSAYCLNEAGILWFQDTPVIPIALPEIKPESMIGFLNSDYKIRRLDDADDIAFIYDTVCDAGNLTRQKISIVTAESHKIAEKYTLIVSAKASTFPKTICKISDVTTDDERIILYYLISKQVRKVSKVSINAWLQENEIYDVNIDNAFDLLSTLGSGTASDDTLELGAEIFRKYSAKQKELCEELLPYLNAHIKLGIDTFKKMWKDDNIDDSVKLFVAYIVDEKMKDFGDRWMQNGQIEDIKQWEEKYSIESILSSDYGKCLSIFIQNNLVYASEWTGYGNARAYTLCKSLKEFLFTVPNQLGQELQGIKDKYHFELPF
jgi:hypothetical protein